MNPLLARMTSVAARPVDPIAGLRTRGGRQFNPLTATAPDQPNGGGDGHLPEYDRAELPRNVDVWDQVLCVSVLVALAILLYAGIRGALFRPLILEAENHGWARLIVRPSMLWGTMGIALLAFRTFLWFCYRSSPPATMADAPSLTVVIPAYNEGEMVLRSIESVAKSRYPGDLLQLLVVDDGSNDDTWSHIQKAVHRYPHLVVARRLPKNCGKRAALAAGFEHARGEIVVTLDSDSVIEPGALLAITGPFRDAAVGAVAGKVKVYNRREGLIPRMLHVRYIVSFDLLRASESGFGTVYCCPGALTAYRTSVVCRMLLRWDRSYVREEVQFLRIVWRRPLGARVIALLDRLITNLRYPVHYACLVVLCGFLPQHPLAMVRLVIVVGVVSPMNMLYYLRSERSPDFFYGIVYSYFSLISLFWIFPVAVFTVRSRSWLTR